MPEQHVSYIHVSTLEQSSVRQLDGVELERVFTDTCSGRDAARPALSACLDWLRQGDVLHVHSIDRLARNLADLQSLVDRLTSQGVSVRFHQEGLFFQADGRSDPMQRLLFQVTGAFAEFERRLIRERQREGIALAKKRGAYRGRKRALTPDRVAELRRRVQSGETKTALAREFGISRETVYQYLRTASLCCAPTNVPPYL